MLVVNDIPKYMIICLLLTIVLELVIGLIIGIRNKKDILNIILVNILTNPLVVSISTYVYMFYGKQNKMYSMIILELFAFITEGLIYRKVLEYKKINGVLVSLILNLFSYSVGFIILNYL